MAAALLLISDREPLAWLLTTGRFAVPAARSSSVPAPGSTVFLYTTRACYRNPGRDRGRIIGEAEVIEGVKHLGHPVAFRGRQYAEGFALKITGVAPYSSGVELARLVGALHALPDPNTWSVRLRRSLVPLDDHDEKLVRDALTPMLQPLDAVIADYLVACRVVQRSTVAEHRSSAPAPLPARGPGGAGESYWSAATPSA